MPTVRAPIADVTQTLTKILERETRAVSKNNLLSRQEQQDAPAHIAEAAEALRAAGGPGTRVTVEALDETLKDAALSLIGSVNQSSGSGQGLVSRKEAEGAFARNPALGLRVLQAYEIVTGRGLDVDALAETRVAADVTDPSQVFKRFATEAEAERYADPDGRQVTWLVAEADGLLTKSYVWGRNDLWAERFDVDKLDGTVTVTAEH